MWTFTSGSSEFMSLHTRTSVRVQHPLLAPPSAAAGSRSVLISAAALGTLTTTTTISATGTPGSACWSLAPVPFRGRCPWASESPVTPRLPWPNAELQSGLRCDDGQPPFEGYLLTPIVDQD